MKFRRRLFGLLFAAALPMAAALLPCPAANAAAVNAAAVDASVPAEYGYTMELSPPSATIHAGGTTRITVSFHADRHLYGTPVDLSVSGLPDGVTASVSPRTPRIGGTAKLTFTTASSSPAGPFALTVTAITLSSDPIGTSTPFALTISTG
jgi:hypothetical protein